MPPRCSCGLIYIWPRGPAWSCRRLCAQTALAMGNVYPSRSVHYRKCCFLIGKYNAFQTHISELLQRAELEGVCRSPAASHPPLCVGGSQVSSPQEGATTRRPMREGAALPLPNPSFRLNTGPTPMRMTIAHHHASLARSTGVL
jgi:hypothetical protein